MEFVPFGEIDESNSTGTQLHVKEEPQSEFVDHFVAEPVLSAMASSFQRIKSESESEEEITDRPCKRRRKSQRTDKPVRKNALRNCNRDGGKNGKPELTQLPCIVSIKSSVVPESDTQLNHNGALDTSNGILNSSFQSSFPEGTYESDYQIALNGTTEQNSSANNFTSKVYEVLVGIQSTLKDLQAAVAENSRKIDQLQNFIPQPWSWNNIKNEFSFPLSTDEQLLELDRQLDSSETANKLVVHLTSRAYTSMKEMILLCLKYMLSRNVAVLYNLNGIKGTKKKFRDLNICNILVDCVQYKFKEATPLEILKRISLTLAGAGDWQGSRRRKK